MEGREVHQWQPAYPPGSEYFLDSGDLLRCARDPDQKRFKAGGQDGILERLAWDGTVLWRWKFSEDEYCQHHDIDPTPDGTILFIAWELKTREQAVQAGRHPAYVPAQGLWSDFVMEIDPSGPDGAEVVWEWHVWDHLIQDLDPSADHYGSPGEHPERIDINADLREEKIGADDVEQLKALGYIASDPKPEDLQSDWLHCNGIDYNPQLDQIVLSVPHMSEIWIIDHSTSPDEAAGSEGGGCGRGGDLLYRYGNPRMHRAGEEADQVLFYQHDARWIPPGSPGAGNLTVFNNRGGSDREHSLVMEIAPPLDEDGRYPMEPYQPCGPEAPVWQYQAPDFFSGFISGATRLPNGNTLICEGAEGRLIEVTREGQIVWEYLHSFGEAKGAAAIGIPPHALFRATRIAADHPGLAGKRLTPLAN